MILTYLTYTSCFRKLSKKTLLFSVTFLEGEFDPSVISMTNGFQYPEIRIIEPTNQSTV